MKRCRHWMTMCGVLLLIPGCSNLFTPRIEPHPDAPILVLDTFGGLFEGAIYDAEKNQLVPCGWFWFNQYEGWTLHKFDWYSRRMEEAKKAKKEEDTDIENPSSTPSIE